MSIIKKFRSMYNLYELTCLIYKLIKYLLNMNNGGLYDKYLIKSFNFKFYELKKL